MKKRLGGPTYLSRPLMSSYGNHSNDLHYKSFDWVLYYAIRGLHKILSGIRKKSEIFGPCLTLIGPNLILLAFITQQTITCSKSTIETLEKSWNVFKVNDVVLVSLLLTLNIFHTHFQCLYLLTLNIYLLAGCYFSRHCNWYEEKMKTFLNIEFFFFFLPGFSFTNIHDSQDRRRLFR